MAMYTDSVQMVEKFEPVTHGWEPCNLLSAHAQACAARGVRWLRLVEDPHRASAAATVLPQPLQHPTSAVLVPGSGMSRGVNNG